MPLNRRQSRTMYLVADIYKPLSPSVDETNSGLDFGWPVLPTRRGVRCMHTQGQEDNMPTVTGRGEGEYAENIDRFKFARDVELGDGYLIHVRSKIEADDGVFYVMQGSSSDRPARNRRRASQRRVSAKKIPQPGNVQPPPVFDEELI